MNAKHICEEYEGALTEAFFNEEIDENIESLIACLPPNVQHTSFTLTTQNIYQAIRLLCARSFRFLANLFARKYNRMTPLMACILSKRYEYVDKLLERMSMDEINAKSPYGLTALTLAASDNTERGAEIVGKLIDAGGNVSVKDNMGWGVLTKSVLNSPDLSLIRRLVEKGADVNEISEIKMTPLMVSTKRRDGKCDFARLLMEMGARTDIQTTDGRTAYDFAEETGNQEMMDLLQPQWVRMIRQIQQFIAQLRENIGRVPAIQRGNESCILPKEVSHAPDETFSGRTFLMSAATEFASTNLERLLKSGKEDVNARDENGQTALYYALGSRSRNTLMALLDGGANPNKVDNNGICTLSYAIIADFCGALELLLDKKANPNLPDAYGRTPLFYLLDSNVTLRDFAVRDAALEILLKHGANIMWKDKEGITPLNLADKKNDGSAKILKKLGTHNITQIR